MMKQITYRKIVLVAVIIFGLITAFGCSSKDNVKYSSESDIRHDTKSQATKDDDSRNGYQERYQDYY